VGRQVQEDEGRALLGLLTPVAGCRVLDAGAGDGRLAVELAAAGARVTALDLSAHMLDVARERARRAGVSLEAVQGDIEALPFPSATFHRVVVSTVLCFVPHPRKAVLELARVLAPGGSLVMAELGRWSPWNLRRRIRGRKGDPLWGRARFWTRGELEGVAREAGLTPDAWDSAVFYSPETHGWRISRVLEQTLAGRTSLGAAFVAIRGVKPGE
jgi:SAM-dependent methyltransferase